jgi:tRNA A-37 threonylcarbamoyl transferase component Bud32
VGGSEKSLYVIKMKELSFKKISDREIKGWVSDEIFNLLPSSFFEDPVSLIEEMDGKVIKKSRRRWAAILTLPNQQRIFFKRDRTDGRAESLKYLLFPSKARKEWFVADQLRKRNLNIPQPLGWFEKAHWGFLKESYYLSEAIGTGTSLIEEPLKWGGSLYLDELARTVRRIHDSGLFHRDLHGGNFLWDGASFFLTDLHRAKILRSVSFNQRLLNLAQIFHSLRSGWGDEERLRFIGKYFEGEPILQKREELLREIRSLMGHLQKRQWKSRTKRCLKESTEFSVQREKGIYYRYRRDYPLDRLKKVIEEHLSLISERPSVLAKLSSEVIVSLVNDGRGKVGVKQFRYSHFWDIFKNLFRPSKGLRAWIAGNGLMMRGIPSLRPLALLEQRNWWGSGESFFVMEASEKGLEMDRYILRGFGDFRRKWLFVKHFAQWLSHLHQRDLYHRDMKTCNILVSENGETWDFHLLDLEDVRLDEKVNEKRLFKNLLQLNTSIPKTITQTDRLRFLKEYIRHQPVIRDDKDFIYQLMRKSREREVVYVSAQGVVEER